MDEIRSLIEKAVAAHRRRAAGRRSEIEREVEVDPSASYCGECYEGWRIQDGRAHRCPCVGRRHVASRQREIDRILDRHRAGMGRRLGRASEATWVTRPGQEMVRPVLDEYLRDLARGERYGLFLYGPPGVGKSWASAYVVNVARARRILPAAFVHFARVLAALKNTFRDEAEHRRLMDLLYETPLLAIDDLGMEQRTAEDPESSWSASEFYKVIDFRHEEELPTIITSNRSPDDLADRLGESVVSRLKRMCRKPLFMNETT